MEMGMQKGRRESSLFNGLSSELELVSTGNPQAAAFLWVAIAVAVSSSHSATVYVLIRAIVNKVFVKQVVDGCVEGQLFPWLVTSANVELRKGFVVAQGLCRSRSCGIGRIWVATVSLAAVFSTGPCTPLRRRLPVKT